VIVRGARQQAANAFNKEVFDLLCSLSQRDLSQRLAIFMLSRRA
jgi:hypothetical protein